MPLVVDDGSNYLDWYFLAFGGGYSDEWDLKFTDPKNIEVGKFLRVRSAGVTSRS
ncbi:hypothetical protein [Rothia sp. ZJ1223]|uniref:hypothetical protein n=1 Tax=Rothia sp. ZJ1223 TaxID=2811098 RepID=UPI001959E7C1|nr:hypothetical protein [Rothia sp. ZJ1223]MBM7052122.1 hypothetical protein [Rothia sp. ZJ1223]